MRRWSTLFVGRSSSSRASLWLPRGGVASSVLASSPAGGRHRYPVIDRLLQSRERAFAIRFLAAIALRLDDKDAVGSMERSYFVTWVPLWTTRFRLRTTALGTWRVLQEHDLNNVLIAGCVS